MADELTRMFGLQNERAVPFRPPKSRARLWVGGVGLVLCTALVAAITLTPGSGGTGFEEAVQRLLGILHRRGAPEWLGFAELEFAANIAMFVPLGFFVCLLLPRRAQWLGILLLPLTSAGIEWAQLTVVADRVPDVRDIVSNSIGGWIGVVAAMLVRAAVHARDAKVAARANWEKRYGKR